MDGVRGARREGSQWSTGKWIAAMLAIAVNLGFIAFLVFSVTWQNRKETPSASNSTLPRRRRRRSRRPSRPNPRRRNPNRPNRRRSHPSRPRTAEAASPSRRSRSPKVEPPAPSKADIALKAKQEQAERARVEKEKRDAEKREADKREAEKKKQDDKRLADARERQAREAEALKAQAERERVAAAKAADAAQAKAMDDYIRRIQARIKGNVVLPPDIAGNPEAVFDVLQLPTGEIIDVQLRKSSGVRAYDEAVQRAIIKASPLPKPEVADLFRRNLTLKFRPSD